MRFTKLSLISLAAMMLSAATANSAVLTDYFSGVVTMSTTTAPVVGETIRGSLTYDTSTDTLTSIGDPFSGTLSEANALIEGGDYTSSASVTPALADFEGGISIVFSPDTFATNGYEVTVTGSFPATSVAAFLQSPPPFTGGSISWVQNFNSTLGGSSSFGYTATLESFSTTIPEPSTWAMSLVGFAGLSLAGYRRRKIRLMAVG